MCLTEECPVALCCFHRPVFPVTRVIVVDTLIAGGMTYGEELRIRLYSVDTPGRGVFSALAATDPLPRLFGGFFLTE